MSSLYRFVGRILMVLIFGIVFAGHASAASAQRAKTPASRAKTVKHASTSSDQRVYHTMRRGQTLYSIAREYGVPLKTLAAANKIANPAKVSAGTRLVIPITRPVSTATARVVPHARVSQKMPPTTAAQQELPSEHELPAEHSVPAAHAADTQHVFLTAPLGWPVDGEVVSAFARPRRGHRHKGIDIKSEEGAPFRAVADGIVIRVEENYGRYGRLIVIEHENGMESYYGHNKQNLVQIGQSVTAEQTIGLVGHSGNATCDHLHFELHVRGQAVDPLAALATLPNGPARTNPREPLATASTTRSDEPVTAAPGTRR